MSEDATAIVSALNAVISEVRTAARQFQGDSGLAVLEIPNRDIANRLHMRCLSAIERFAPPGSYYHKRAAQYASNSSGTLTLAAILEALRDDYKSGGMQTVTELVHAALFDDFLDMAAELNEKGFHGPAAVLAGCVLEEHLRKLAEKAAIPLRDERDRPKSVETLGTELVKQSVISEPRRKIISGWYGQRTEGAHGRFTNVVPEEVPRTIEGIRDFVATYPA
jgi:hypothetical protein